MWTKRSHRPFLACLVALATLAPLDSARAQYVDRFFQPTIPGFGTEQGVTVLGRLRPLFEQPGIRAGAALVRINLDEYAGYDSAYDGSARGAGSAVVRTSPSVAAATDWSRGRIGAAVSVDNYAFLAAPRNNYTNVATSVGAGYLIGRNELNVGYSHLRQHELATDIGAVATSTPLTYDVDAVRMDYTIESGRFAFTPNADVRLFRYGDATIGGQRTSERFRNRDVLTGGVTTRYSLTDQDAAVLASQWSTSRYRAPQAGLPSNDSSSVLLLGGMESRGSGPWRFVLLAGVQVRRFTAAEYGTKVAPALEATVIWSPTGLTTLTGTVRRAIEDATAELTGGYTYTAARLVLDHELKRNVLLQARTEVQEAEFLQSAGTSTSVTAGAGVTWLLNRRLRLTADYDVTRQSGGGSGQPPSQQQGPLLQTGSTLSGSYTRHVILTGVRIGL